MLHEYTTRSDTRVAIYGAKTMGQVWLRYAGHARELARTGVPAQNDLLWDFYKLLMVPSPIRIFFSLCSEKYRPSLRAELDRMVAQYSDEEGCCRGAPLGTRSPR